MKDEMTSDGAGEPAEELAGAEVTVQTGPDYKLGDAVQHVDDPEVRGRVIGLRREGGQVWARISGVANWLPAGALELDEQEGGLRR